MENQIVIDKNIPIPERKSKMVVKKYIFDCGFCGAKLNTETGCTSLPPDTDAFSMQKLRLKIERLEKELAKFKPETKIEVKSGEEKKGSSWF